MSSSRRAGPRRWLRALRERRGIASIEFAIVMSTLSVIVMGTYDIGNYELQQTQLAEAAAAGGQDAVAYPPTDVNDPNDANTQNLLAAIAQALPPNWVLGTDYTVNLSMTCTCGGTLPTTERLVTISISRPYTSLLGLPGLNLTSVTYVARTQ